MGLSDICSNSSFLPFAGCSLFGAGTLRDEPFYILIYNMDNDIIPYDEYAYQDAITKFDEAVMRLHDFAMSHLDKYYIVFGEPSFYNTGFYFSPPTEQYLYDKCAFYELSSREEVLSYYLNNKDILPSLRFLRFNATNYLFGGYPVNVSVCTISGLINMCCQNLDYSPIVRLLGGA